MHRSVAMLALLLAACGKLDRPAAPAPRKTRPTGPVIAFVGAHVVPMDRERVQRGMTVLVQGGVVTKVTKDAPPAGATVLDARGRYLMPGLCDMHVHNWYEEEHVLFLANGVTRIRNMWGTPLHLKWRSEIEAGTRVGPRLHTTAPIADGEEPIWEKSIPVKTPEAAVALVRKWKAEGYEGVKVYNRLKRGVYEALAAEAHRLQMRMTGHVPYAARIEGALGNGQDCIEHLSGYIAWRPVLPQARQDELVRLTKTAGTWNCPTLVVYRKFVPRNKVRELAARPEMRFVPPRLRATWDPQKDFRTKNMTAAQYRDNAATDRLRMRLVKALHDATGRVLAGTDVGNPFVVAGWSLHEELACLVEAGLTPFEALSCATTKPAEYLGDGKGTIEKGQRADLIVLEQNPLEDVAHAQMPLGVMANGRWYTREQLEEMLERVARSYQEPKDRFRDMPDEPHWSGRYEILWNGLVVGEERFVMEWGMQIRMQQVNDPPFRTRRTATIIKGLDGALRVHGTIEDIRGKRVGKRQGKPGEAWGAGGLASWTFAMQRFREAPLHQPRRFDFHELDLESEADVKKIPTTLTRTGERTFNLVMKHEDGTFTSRLVLTEAGWPERMTTELQQGTVEYRLVK